MLRTIALQSFFQIWSNSNWLRVPTGTGGEIIFTIFSSLYKIQSSDWGHLNFPLNVLCMTFTWKSARPTTLTTSPWYCFESYSMTTQSPTGLSEFVSIKGPDHTKKRCRKNINIALPIFDVFWEWPMIIIKNHTKKKMDKKELFRLWSD